MRIPLFMPSGRAFFAGKKKALAQNNNAYDVEYKRFALPLHPVKLRLGNLEQALLLSVCGIVAKTL